MRWWFDETRRNALPSIKLLGLPVLDASATHDDKFTLASNPPKHLDLLHFLSPCQEYIPFGVALLLILGAFFSRAKKRVALFGIYALTLHFGGTLLVCLSTVAIPRYSVPLDVLFIIAIGCAIDLSGFHAKAFAAKFSQLKHT